MPAFLALSLSLHVSLSLSLSFLLITSPLLLSFAFHYSIFSSDFYPLALPLPLVSLRLRAVPALMQLVITKPLIWSLNFPNLEKGRGWRKKMKQQRQTGAGWAITWSGGKRRVSSVWRHQNTLSQLSAVQLSSQPVSHKTQRQLIGGSSLPHTVDIDSCYGHIITVPRLQCAHKNAEERISELLSALTYSECGNTEPRRERERESVKWRSSKW